MENNAFGSTGALFGFSGALPDLSGRAAHGLRGVGSHRRQPVQDRRAPEASLQLLKNKLSKPSKPRGALFRGVTEPAEVPELRA